jgi:nucleotide-binding universal stress UspA family protein
MFRKLVVGSDGSARAERAVQEAVDLAKSQGAELHLVAVFGENERHWESIESSSKIQSVSLRGAAESVLARSAAKAAEQGVRVGYSAHEGEPAEVLLEVAAEQGADLIVIGNKGMTGAGRFLQGSVPNKISHHADCSVLVVRTD